MEAPPAEPVKDEEDDLNTPVPEGAKCKRRACGVAWEGEDVSRGKGEKAKCTYHPLGVSLPVEPKVSKAQLTCSRSFTRERNIMHVAPNAKYWNLMNS
jgi:hypothetical protein